MYINLATAPALSRSGRRAQPRPVESADSALSPL